jgi:Outer membrane lipoprotein-sorting protein
MKFFLAAAAVVFLLAFGVTAQTTNGPSQAEIQGQQLARQLCDGLPAESTNIGVLQIRGAQGGYSEVPVKSEITLTATNWQSLYQAGVTNRNFTLLVVHAVGQRNEYFYRTNSAERVPILGDVPALGHLFRGRQLSATELMTPFAGSDFWVGDLGLEFFHWPEQKIVKKEFARGRGCMVLESTNPNPSPNGYSRVDSWIDEETLGIVQAKAYDAQGKLLKEFYPKDFKKVNGQWQLESMEIDNDQTGSRTRIEFNLKPR